MTHEYYQWRLDNYGKRRIAGTGWPVREGATREQLTRMRDACRCPQCAPPWECRTCDGEGVIDDWHERWRVCPSCGGKGDFLPEPELSSTGTGPRR